MYGNQVRIPIYVPPELATRFADLARENERSASAEARLAIKRHLEASDAARSERSKAAA